MDVEERPSASSVSLYQPRHVRTVCVKWFAWSSAHGTSLIVLSRLRFNYLGDNRRRLLSCIVGQYTVCGRLVVFQLWIARSQQAPCLAQTTPTQLPHWCWLCTGGSVISRAGPGSESKSHETSIMLLLLPALEFRLLPPRPRTVLVVCP